MNKIIGKFQKFQNAINTLTSFILILIMVIILAQTFFRFVIFKSIPWSEELSRYLFVAMIALGINISVTKDLMVSIDIIDNYLNRKSKRILKIIRNLISLVVSCVLFFSSFDMIKVGFVQKSPALQIPLGVMYIILCVGFLLSSLALIAKIYAEAKGEEN